jgi:hypothetical protein
MVGINQNAAKMILPDEKSDVPIVFLSATLDEGQC